MCPLLGGSWVTIKHNVTWAEAYLHTKWHRDPSSRLATIGMGQKLGAEGQDTPFYKRLPKKTYLAKSVKMGQKGGKTERPSSCCSWARLFSISEACFTSSASFLCTAVDNDQLKPTTPCDDDRLKPTSPCDDRLKPTSLHNNNCLQQPAVI